VKNKVHNNIQGLTGNEKLKQERMSTGSHLSIFIVQGMTDTGGKFMQILSFFCLRNGNMRSKVVQFSAPFISIHFQAWYEITGKEDLFKNNCCCK